MTEPTERNGDIPTDLGRTDAYAPLRPSKVTRVETHISWVFLLEHDVFKLKKPVNFGFLDFRTLEQRKAACEAEVVLNGRLAADVYRGIVPVRRQANGRLRVEINGPRRQGASDSSNETDDIVEWAVHMRRLDDEHRADLLVARHALSQDALDAIAERIARFHAQARCDEHTSTFGTTQAVKRNIEENFDQTRDAIERYIRAEEAEEIRRRQRAFVDANETTFNERIRQGRVRDGHGDLRLEHIYIEGGKPTIIDCIEFNERFRFADVCADIAFLSMDLAHQSRVDLAERLLARYARDANDFDLYALVDFYQSYRAFIRGKVSALVEADESTAREIRELAHLDARRYFLLALAAERRPVLPRALVAVGGVIASGKSTIAEQLGTLLGAPIVDADRTRKFLAGVEPTQRLHEAVWHGAYDPSVSEAVYAEVLRRGGVVLASGRPVVLDASFRSAATRRAARAMAERLNVPFFFIECRANPELGRARLRERETKVGVSDGRLAIFDAFRASFEPITELTLAEHIVVNTAQPLEETMAFLRERLPTWPERLVT